MPKPDDLRESDSGMFVTQQPLDIGLTIKAVDEQARAEALARDPGAGRAAAATAPRVSLTRTFDEQRYSVRTYIPADEGEGYWDVYKFSSDVFVLVGECRFEKDKWIDVPGEKCFKIRFLQSGCLLNASGESFLGPEEAMYELYPGELGDGYFVQAGESCRLVMLHCSIEKLLTELNLDPSTSPMPFRALADTEHGEELIDHRFSPGMDIVDSMAQILEKRDLFDANLRLWYVEAKAKEVFASIVQSILQEPEITLAANRITRRDHQRILEARDIIAANIENVPTIPELARMVGTNQTKLKIGFKQVIGMTIGNFVTKKKMDMAATMLTSTDLVISQISQSLGYGHSGNFTQAFKRHFGRVPRDYRRHTGPIRQSAIQTEERTEER